MTEEKIHKERHGSWWALSPLLVFLCLYLVTSILVNDFYKVPITVAFLVSSCYAIAITRGLKLDQRIYQFSVGAANKNILLMIWIFILAGAFAQSAKQMGAIDATVNLTLHILPDNLLLAGIFIAACFISLSIGTSVGTIVALTPVAVGLAEKTEIALPFMVAVVVGGSFFGDNLSFISDTTIASTKTQECVMRDKFRVNSMIVVPAAIIVLGIYIFQGLSITAPAQVQTIEWIKVIPYIIVLNKCEQFTQEDERLRVQENTASYLKTEKEKILLVSAADKSGIYELKEELGALKGKEEEERKIVGDLLEPSDFVVLVVPIDSAAPKGRLILPQQQVIRDVLESGATAIVCRDTELADTLKKLGQPPKLVITDSQAFASVSKDTPKNIPLTSFSILFSRYKGDLQTQIEGVKMLDKLKDGDTILMAEGCTHHRQCDDIGTVKLPRWISEYTGKKLNFATSSGGGFPENLSPYRLIVHCGGCTLSKREMAFRIAEAKDQNVPIVNYGTIIAQLKDVLKRSIAPFADELS